MPRCGVANCVFVGDESIDGFPVCTLHNAPQTRAIVLRFKRPGAYVFHGHPVVIPVGDLEEAHFFLTGGRPCVVTDPVLADLDPDDRGGHPDYDLFK
jgi:hypothetical protein